MYLALHFLLRANTRSMWSGWNRERGERERGREKECHEKLLIYKTKKDKILVPKFYISQTWAFSMMQVPHREIYTLKIKPCTNDQIHKKPNQNVLTIVVVVVTVVMFLESYSHDWCFPLPSLIRTTPSSPCQPPQHLPAKRAPSELASRTLQWHKEQSQGRPHSEGQGRM